MEAKPMITEQHKENFDSALSYGIGGGSALAGYLVDISQEAQAVAIVFGAVVVGIRMVHDMIKLYRFVKKGKDE